MRFRPRSGSDSNYWKRSRRRSATSRATRTATQTCPRATSFMRLCPWSKMIEDGRTGSNRVEDVLNRVGGVKPPTMILVTCSSDLRIYFPPSDNQRDSMTSRHVSSTHLQPIFDSPSIAFDRLRQPLTRLEPFWPPRNPSRVVSCEPLFQVAHAELHETARMSFQ